MARYGPADCTVSWAGSLVPDVTVVGDLNKKGLIEEVTPVAVSAQSKAAVGITNMEPLTLEAPYSTDAGNLRAVAEASGLNATVAMIITIGGTKTSTFSAIVSGINRSVKRGALTLFQVTIEPTGTITEA